MRLAIKHAAIAAATGVFAILPIRLARADDTVGAPRPDDRVVAPPPGAGDPVVAARVDEPVSTVNADNLPPPPTGNWGNRTLAGHTFLYPVSHRGAFITTDFGVAQGVYNERIPSVPLPFGGTANLNLIGAITTASLGLKFADWFGVQAAGTGLAVFGVDGESILYAGGKLNAGGYLAPIFRLARVKSSGTQISARAQMGWVAGDSLDIPQFLVLGRSAIASVSGAPDAQTAAAGIARGIIQGGLTRTILSGTDVFGLNTSVEAAQAIGPMVGLQAAVTLQRRVIGLTFHDPSAGSTRTSSTRYDMLFDLSAEWDGNSVHVPLALIVENEVNARLSGTGEETLEQDSSTVDTLGAGIYYSGRRDLQVGLFAATARNLRTVGGIAGAPGLSGAPSANYSEMVLRYIW